LIKSGIEIPETHIQYVFSNKGSLYHVTLSNKKEKSRRGRPEKTDRKELTNAIKSIIEKRMEENPEEDSTIIKPNRIAAEIELLHGKEISPQTIRNKGAAPGGYYPVKYQSIEYIQGEIDKVYWGMNIQRQQFLNEVKQE